MVSKRGAGKRLSDSERLEIIKRLRPSKAPSKRELAREYGVSEKAVRKTSIQVDKIIEQSAISSISHRGKTFRIIQAKYHVLEDKLFLWVDAARRFNVMLPPIIVMRKALSIAADMEFRLKILKPLGNGCIDLGLEITLDICFSVETEQKWTRMTLNY